MRQLLRSVLGALPLCAALLLSACTFSDALLNKPVASVWASTPAIRPPTVVFATDRAQGIPSEVGDFFYGPHWDDQLHCGAATLTLTKGWPQFNVAQPVVGDAACQGDLGDFGKALKDAEPRQGCRRVLLFVHGYNTTFRTALLRAGQIAADTQWPCAVGVFSWSSEGKFDRYAADIERSGYAVPELANALRAIAHAQLETDIVAHSMGTRLTLSALGALSRSCDQTGSKIVNELILAAPDVSAEHYNDDFLHLLAKAMHCTRHVTVYASENDMVLMASKSIHGGIPRAGRVPEKDLQYPACEGLAADIVDASRAPGDELGHGYFMLSYEMVKDITWTLARKTMKERAGRGLPGGATLVSEPPVTVDCNADQPAHEAMIERYALLVSPLRQPDVATRFLRRVIPIVIPVE